ncbi:DNA-binding protein [Nocardia panacis]|uniref:DNA-binding protein n=1 Tax=Nocardia panacis TaxID=2340916 RepID=A0A3A4KJX6_9NOCA|nr:DNA-binding protein [Nocardia panacis]RJO80237.1 DNA-binding protein [Nocardia panacis]
MKRTTVAVVPVPPEPRLTPEQLEERWPGITRQRLAQWRYLRVGPDYIKVGKSVFYPLSSVLDYEQRNTVTCGGAA